MESPAKRRKKTQAKSVPHRSLDYFFGKQPSQQRKEQEGSVAGVHPVKEPEDNPYLGLTDEELARKLQQEWNREDGQGTTDVDIMAPPVLVPERDRKQPNWAQDLDGRAQDISTTTTTSSKKDFLELQSVADTEDETALNIPFDQSPLEFDPAVYLADLKRRWSVAGGDATYALLTRCFVLVNSTQSRIKIVDTLVNCLRTLIEGDPESLLPAVWLATNSISPPYVSLELGLGGSAISKALKKVCGLDGAGLKTLYDKYGDAGDVAFEAKKKQSFILRKPKPLSIKSVYKLLVKIANSKGPGSVEQKQKLVERLIQDARGAEESRYIVRTLCQHLRIGAVKTTMLIALSRAFLLSRPLGADYPIKERGALQKLKKEELTQVWLQAEEMVKGCFARRPNYNDLVPCLLEIGVCDELMLRCGLALHIPLRPMLGSITRDLGEMLTKLQGRDFGCEFKYDGQRAQVHCDELGQVSIFSRHLEVMTEKYPDLVALVPEIRGDGVSSFILEGEVVAVDQSTGELKTFQTLTNRAKKGVDINSIQVDVCLFAFDLMYLNGQSLLDRPFRERRGLLRNMFIQKQHRFTWVESIDATSADSERVLEFFKSATDAKCEGIMVKVLDNPPKADLGGFDNTPAPTTPSKAKTVKKGASAQEGESGKGSSSTRRKALLSTYEPDKRLDSWLKVKKDYSTSADTIDLIPVAGWHGQGRKAKWWSPILLACRDPASGSLQVVTKCISGFTDAFYKANREKYDEDGPNTRKQKPSYIEYSGQHPELWFEPQEVWEMAFADITLSPTYTAAIGLVSDERGLSLRFPRFLKVREDKSIDEASTSDYLADLFRKQEQRLGAHGSVGKREARSALIGLGTAHLALARIMGSSSDPSTITWSAQFTVARGNKVLVGDKIILPQSALEGLLAAAPVVKLDDGQPQNLTRHFDPFNPYSFAAEAHAREVLAERQQQLPHPLTFRLVNPRNGHVVYAGIREFSAEENEVQLSDFLRDALGVVDTETTDMVDTETTDMVGTGTTDEVDTGTTDEVDTETTDEVDTETTDEVDTETTDGPAVPSQPETVTVHAQQLAKGTYVRLRPLEAGYDVEDWKALLERYLRGNFTTLTVNQVLDVPGPKGEHFRFLIDKFEPESDAICVVDTDLEVDIEPLSEEQARETLNRRLEKAKTAPGTKQGSSVGGVLKLEDEVHGQVVPGEYVDYKLAEWATYPDLDVEVSADSELPVSVDVLVSPISARFQSKPRADEHVLGDMSSRPTKRIKLAHGDIDPAADALAISVHAWQSEPAEGTLPPIAYKLAVQAIPKRTLPLHEAFCYRNNISCPKCQAVFLKTSDTWKTHWHCPHDDDYGNGEISQRKHNAIFHPDRPFTCHGCGFSAFDLSILAQHRTSSCPAKEILCQFCHLLVPQQGPDDPAFNDPDVLLSGLTPHELSDGARTTECHLCGRFVRLRDMKTHLGLHDRERLARPRPTVCTNPVCARRIKSAGSGGNTHTDQHQQQLGLCNECFAPLYGTTHDPEGKALRRRIERRLLQQLLAGCGKSWCRNADWCRSGQSHLSGVLEQLKAGTGSAALCFCVDETTQTRRVLADAMAAATQSSSSGDGDGDGGYAVEWCIKALEESRNDGAQAHDWLRAHAPRINEVVR
ncbi:hypothetical protein DV738_g2136, partial [Chaetothyriales sp. CBS 135597]